MQDWSFKSARIPVLSTLTLPVYVVWGFDGVTTFVPYEMLFFYIPQICIANKQETLIRPFGAFFYQ